MGEVFSLTTLSLIFLCPWISLNNIILWDKEEAGITLPISEMRKLRNGIFLGPELETELRCEPRLSAPSWTPLPVAFAVSGLPLTPRPRLEGVVTTAQCF